MPARISPQAQADLEQIWLYIAEDSPDAASRFVNRLLDHVELLGNSPGIGHRRRDLAGGRALLFFPLGEYLIIYRATQRTVEIVRVVHSRRDIERLLRGS